MTADPGLVFALRRRRALRAAALFLALKALPLDAQTPSSAPEGNWLTDDGKGVVAIAACGAQLCGHIARVLDHGPDVPTKDINNPDPRLRTRTLVGLRTLWGFTRHGAVWEGGHAYDPKSGNSYRSTLQLAPDGSLKVTGCVLIVCQSRRWTRLR